MAIELGTAYVTVIPEMHGAQAAIGRELGDSAIGAKAGTAVGGGFSSSLKATAIAGAIAAAAAVGLALAEVTKSSLEAYASYEQLTGGIETLFKDSAPIVMQYADEAYKTAGISANQYMEQATSFSASLLQSLGGDTEAAARYADMAIKDMSDNSAKMGTSINDIQNAYQGFAKQNYTMLDNLKLGYGGTKTEMERLLADAEKLSGVHYDIGNLNDVFEAIHVIQGELDITGTTANEAANTIEGSINSMKAEWENWLVALADGNSDMEAETQALVDSVITAAQNVVPRVGQIVSSLFLMIPGMKELVDWIQENIAPIVLPALQQVSDFITNTVVPAVQNAVTVMQPAVQGFLDMIVPLLLNIVDFLSTTVIPLVIEVATFVINTVQEIYTALAPIIDGIVQAVGGAFETISGVVTTIMGVIKGIVTGDWQMASDGVNSILNGLQGIVSGIWNAISNLVSSVMNTISSVVTGVWESISSTVSGVVNGISSTISGVFNGIVSTIQGAMDTARNIVDSAINTISGIFSGAHLELPHINVPHFNIDGGEVPWGIGGEGHPPSISIDWYARGGIVDGAHLIGAGERGSELIWPSYEPYLSKYAEAITNSMGGGQTFNVYANDPLLVASVVASKQRRAYA